MVWRSSLFGCAMALLVHGPATAVIGGRVAEGALKHATLMVLGAGGDVCSGIVIAPRIVLTAAHCVVGGGEKRVHFMGRDGQPALIAPQAIAIHPGYDAGAIKGRRRSIDLALIRLPEPLPAPFAPAVLSQEAAPPRAGASIIVGGYGTARERDAKSMGAFREAALSVVEPYGPGSVLVWAADPAGLGRKPGAGACQGDSGGPLAVDGTVIAVTSWAEGFGKTGCGRFTQGVLVGPQSGWIGQITAQWHGK
jgi:hypothetical protein